MKKTIIFLTLTTCFAMYSCTNSGKSDKYGNSEDKSGNNSNYNNGSQSGDQNANQTEGQGSANGNQNLPGNANKEDHTANPRQNPDSSTTYDNSNIKKGTGKSDPK